MLGALVNINNDNQPFQSKNLQNIQLLHTFNRIAESFDLKNACIIVNTQFFVLLKLSSNFFSRRERKAAMISMVNG